MSSAAVTSFGRHVFGDDQLTRYLSKADIATFEAQRAGRFALSKSIADRIAHAVKLWAIGEGANHYTHWFQPLTGTTAEKHDAFLEIQNGQPMDRFSGKELVQAEPDASSFPSGGMRATFEARGYSIWDTASPFFIRQRGEESVLYVPSIFIAFTGDALDEKTFLLRSISGLSKHLTECLHLLGHSDVDHVKVSLGTEQEFFLVDEEAATGRVDLQQAGRCLFGRLPCKHQQLSDHYFGSIPSRVLKAIGAAERELWSLGVPSKTRHNEVAPCQFEVAPIFEDAVVAVDHNLLTMEVLKSTAKQQGLLCLFHEKPFDGVNGSGKHCNWSVCTSTGNNLLEPGDEPQNNIPFLLCMTAVIVGVHRHGGLLRASVGSQTNDQRLGSHEAPPGIISVFLGDYLYGVIKAVSVGGAVDPPPAPAPKQVYVSASGKALEVQTIPEYTPELSDRNRTSPFAFTGNKFEFRAVGSNQSPAFPVTIMNAAVAEACADLAAALRGVDCSVEENVKGVLSDFLMKHMAVCFEGDNYTEEWAAEAERRGLPSFRNSLEAFDQLLLPASCSLLVDRLTIFNNRELNARHVILQETYWTRVSIEVGLLVTMYYQEVMPAVSAYKTDLARAVTALAGVPDIDTTPEITTLRRIAELASDLQADVCQLEMWLQETKRDVMILRRMDDAKTTLDALEGLMSRKHWTVPDLRSIFCIGG
ncbi:MAG: hypothetical protein KVP17_002988 [Porospora cf. gigantea B]|uniref:uncharacterized protein n=1 Tax=Porospora cf. gigantea B TaxID=2853592 RepID=UPI003571E9F2|nr:MAG: hypothetical protein KVP17_002988 [Porospora cf. gigantea B]